MNFKDAVLNTPVATTTTNGMAAYESTLSSNVDLFFKFGASRGNDISKLFEAALLESPEVAIRILQWGRDVRGGAGERELFRQCLLFLEKNYPAILCDPRLLAKIPEIGRWDDLLIFSNESIKSIAYRMIAEALERNDALCAKWMPRKGPIAADLRKFLGWTPKFYRKRLVELTKVVETQMCAKDWSAINFSHVPSLAMARYAKAFGKNASAEFQTYKEALSSGDPSVKVNAAAVYPYDVLKTLKSDPVLASEQWKALPNYVGDAMVLPMVDVSGSMHQPAGGSKSLQCIDVALSLGLYLSDKNTGPFQDLFLTFSTRSEFVHLKGDLAAKRRQMGQSDWAMTTNLNSAFETVLDVAIRNSVDEADMPKYILILSDMQFNECVRNADNRAIEMIRQKYEEAGYKVPAIIFWNLKAHDNVPVRFDERGTALVSGFSPAIMQAILKADAADITPEGLMLKAVGIERYSL